MPWTPRALDAPPSRWAAYGVPTDEPGWYIRAPWCDGQVGLRSSRVIAIAQSDGRVLYDGEAGDEG